MVNKIQEIKRSLKSELWTSIEKYCYFPSAVMEKVVEDKEIPIIEEGNGIYLKDIEGNEYIDVTSGPVACGIGHGNKRVIEAITKQAQKLEYTYYSTQLNIPAIELSRRLGELAPSNLNRVRLGVTGYDAIEIALKATRSFYENKRKNIIISLYGSYHGSQYGTSSLTGMSDYHELYQQNNVPSTLNIPPPNCYRCHYGLEYPECDMLCARVLDNVLREHPDAQNVATFIGEPVLGAGGAIAPPDEYWPMVEEICRDHDVILIMDEVMTGLGRTGKLFGFQHWDIEPDIVTLGKNLASMYQPISAVIFQDCIYGELKDKVMRHDHTASLHPIACAAALANISEIVDGGLVENADKMGKYLGKRLEEMAEDSPHLAAFGGLGLLRHIEIVKSKRDKARFPVSSIPGHRSGVIRSVVQRKCREKGLIIRVLGYNSDSAMFCPPMIVKKEEIDKICDKFSEAIEEINFDRY